MGIPWHSSGPLILDTDGHLWERYRRGHQWHGPIATADVPAHLAPHAEALLDLWVDSFDAEAEARAAYLSSVHGVR